MKTRGNQKLLAAAKAFSFDFHNKIVLDIGSSTGGFTAVALAGGARTVIAIEKGTNQMTAPLRFNPAVELHEKTDIFDVVSEHYQTIRKNNQHETAARLSSSSPSNPQHESVAHSSSYPQNNPRLGPSNPTAPQQEIIIPTPDVILADVSFISLRPVLEYAKTHLAGPQTEFLVMLKPQFEADDKDLNRGVVKNERIRRTIIKDFEEWLLRSHFKILQKKDNDLAGRKGNIERFYLLHCDIME